MNLCDDFENNITLYLDNELTDEERILFEEHLEICDNCRSEFNEVKNLINLLGGLEDEEVPDEFKYKLHNRLVEEQNKQIRNSKLIYKNKYFRIAASLAAVFLIMVFVKGFGDVYLTKYSLKGGGMEKSANKNSKKDGYQESVSPDLAANSQINSPQQTVTPKIITSEVTKDIETPQPQEYIEGQIEVPESTSTIIIKSDDPESEANFVKTILNNDKIKIDDVYSNKTKYLVLTFKYDNRKYKSFIDGINEGVKSNLSISEQNINADLMVIGTLEEQKQRYNELLIKEDDNKSYINEHIKFIENNILKIKNTKYYTKVKVEIYSLLQKR